MKQPSSLIDYIDKNVLYGLDFEVVVFFIKYVDVNNTMSYEVEGLILYIIFETIFMLKLFSAFFKENQLSFLYSQTL